MLVSSRCPLFAAQMYTPQLHVTISPDARNVPTARGSRSRWRNRVRFTNAHSSTTNTHDHTMRHDSTSSAGTADSSFQ